MTSTCAICRSSKANLQCNVCEKSICKNCLETLDSSQYLFHPKPPKIFRHRQFCFPCFESLIQPELQSYEELVEKSHEISVHKKGQKNLLRIRKREQIPESVKDFLSENDAISQLKVLAVSQGFEAICDLETTFKKVRKHGYEHKEWSAKGHFCLLKS